MSKKALVLAALLVSMSFGTLADAASKTPTPVQAQPQAAVGGGGASFAHSWTVYSDKEKRSFLFGLATAVRLMCTDLSTRQKDAQGGPGVEQIFRDCFNAYAGMDPDAVVIGLRFLHTRYMRGTAAGKDVPYGIALAAGAIMALPQSWMVQ